MELTALEFARLLHDLKCDVMPGERRNNPRAPTRVKASIIPISANVTPQRQSVWIRDVSRGGFGLTSQVGLDVGSRLLVVMPKTGVDSFVLLCEICRSQRMQGGTYLMGAKMVRRVTPEEYAGILIGANEVVKSLAA